MQPHDTPKLCGCGCGQPAPIAKLTDRRRGHIKGQPVRYISGHNSRVANASTPSPIKDRFWKYVDPSDKNECWLWRGSMTPNGYGRLKIDGHSFGAHRVSWELHNGPIPEGLQVLHKCDVRNCVSPHHLFLGTGIDNMQDKFSKGRGNTPKGEKTNKAKLTDEYVRQIRQLHAQGLTQREIGMKFGIGQAQVNRIVHYQRWKHVT